MRDHYVIRLVARDDLRTRQDLLEAQRIVTGQAAVAVDEDPAGQLTEVRKRVERPDTLQEALVVEEHMDFQVPVTGWNRAHAQNARKVRRLAAGRGDGTTKRDGLKRADPQQRAANAHLTSGPPHRWR